ncbi:MAG: ferritin-like domain-containing protein [Bacteroidota bacterium]
MAKSSAKKTASSKAPAKKTFVNGKAAGPFTANTDVTLQDFFVSSLKDTYWAENHLVAAIPKMIAAAGSADLKNALTDHLAVTKTHATRLEQAFELLGEKIIAKKCDAIEGLTMSGEHVIDNTVMGSPVRDTGIIMSGLKVENFEITTYTGLIQVANKLDKTDVAELLQQNLDEEIAASDLLTELSESVDFDNR